MKWFRKTFLWASAGCLSAAATASAQPTVWHPLSADEVRPTKASVRLGRPVPIEPETSYVVRGVSATFGDEPKSILPPRDANEPGAYPPVTRPAPAIQSKVVEIDGAGNIVQAQEKLNPPRLSSPGLDPTERIIILDDGDGAAFGNGWGGQQRLYVMGEWLYWTQRGFHLPPLATTASATDDPNTRAALGFQSTQLIYGNNNVNGNATSGGRFTLGYNFDPCGICALEASFFFLGPQSQNATFNSNNFPVIGRPFFNINTGMQDRELTTTPEFTNGSLQIRTSSSLWGAEVNNVFCLWSNCNFTLTGLVGFRYLDLNEHLVIQENTVFNTDVPALVGPPLFNKGDKTFVFDSFSTRNQFYGGQVGANAYWQRGPWSLNTNFKFAMGATVQTIDIDGGQQFTRTNGTVQNFKGGLYALPSNIGHFTQTQFGVVPQVGFNIGYNITDNIRIFVGYDFLYWSSVVRPGDQIDTTLDANKIPNFGAVFPPATQTRPVVPFHTTSYWATGVSAGIQFRY